MEVTIYSIVHRIPIDEVLLKTYVKFTKIHKRV